MRRACRHHRNQLAQLVTPPLVVNASAYVSAIRGAHSWASALAEIRAFCERFRLNAPVNWVLGVSQTALAWR